MLIDHCLIAIAVGGRGERMGGSKPERLLGGRPLIDHMTAWATRQGTVIALAGGGGSSGNADQIPVLPDISVGQGPISALHSAMLLAQSRDIGLVLLAGCDMPFLPSDLGHRMIDQLGDADAVIPSRGGRMHFMAALWRCNVAAIEAYVATGKRSLHGFAEQLPHTVTMMWPDAADDPFFNINTVDELAAAERRFRTATP